MRLLWPKYLVVVVIVVVVFVLVCLGPKHDEAWLAYDRSHGRTNRDQPGRPLLCLLLLPLERSQPSSAPMGNSFCPVATWSPGFRYAIVAWLPS